jgi:hypothetical protein
MPKFIIEQYELHSQKYEVEAPTRAEAVIALFDGEGEILDGSLEYIEVATDYWGPDLLEEEELDVIGKALHNVVWDHMAVESIRDIEEV